MHLSHFSVRTTVGNGWLISRRKPLTRLRSWLLDENETPGAKDVALVHGGRDDAVRHYTYLLGNQSLHVMLALDAE